MITTIMVMAIIKVATVTRITTTITVTKITITITPRIPWGVVAPNQCRWVPVSILSYCSIEVSQTRRGLTLPAQAWVLGLFVPHSDDWLTESC